MTSLFSNDTPFYTSGYFSGNFIIVPDRFCFNENESEWKEISLRETPNAVKLRFLSVPTLKNTSNLVGE